MISYSGLIVCGTALFLAAPLYAADRDDASIAATAQKMDAMAPANGDAKVSATIAGRFATFAGSQANAQALVTGLRNDSSITLTGSVNGQASTATFTPAANKQGFGGVFLSLALAQQDLIKAGVSHPTPEQIEAALNGGAITNGSATANLPGILKLRASGEGWGQIASGLGLKVGRVESDLRKMDEHLEKTGKAERAETARQVDKAEGRVEKNADKIENQVDKPEQPNAVDKPERPTAVEKPERVDVRDQLDLPHPKK